MTEGEDEQSVQVRFTTKQPEFSIPSVIYSVGATSNSEDLSQLVNTVLKESENADDDAYEPVLFQFKSGEDFVKATLEEFIEKNLLKKESVIELEYFAKESAPQPFISCPHPDWVAAVSSIKTKNDTLILTSCYDGSINLWSLADGLVATTQCHSSAVKSVALLTRPNSDEILALSGSHDQTVIISRALPALSRADDWSLEPVVVGRGHAGSVDCIESSPNLQRFASGSWDTMLKIWDVSFEEKNEAAGAVGDAEDNDEDSNEEVSGDTHRGGKRKIRKKNKKSSTSSDQGDGNLSALKRTVPLVTLSGHSEGVSDLAWIDDAELVTVGFDHALVFWDLSTGHEKRKIPGVRAFMSVAYSSSTQCLLTSSADRHIRLYDPRSDDGLVVKSTFTSHSAWVSSVDWSKSADHLFVSGSYDSIMKLWDVRSPKIPLYDMTGHEDKILDVNWSVDDYLISGSADSTMKIFSKRKC